VPLAFLIPEGYKFKPEELVPSQIGALVLNSEAVKSPSIKVL